MACLGTGAPVDSPTGLGMDYHLQNLKTGETFSLNPNRTLIGLAEHADVRSSDPGSYLAGLIVRYATGWAIHGLSDNPAATYNGEPLCIGRQITPRHGDLIEVGEERFRFMSPRGQSTTTSVDKAPTPSLFLYVRSPDGHEECRSVDHDLLFGRLNVCHVRFHDTRLSRLAALLAAHDGQWYVHVLSKGPIGRNKRAVTGFARVEDGDELQIGPLLVRVEIRPAAATPAKTDENPTHSEDQGPDDSRPDTAASTDGDGKTVESPLSLEDEVKVNLASIRASALRLDYWLRDQTPTPPPPSHGISGWLGAQKLKLNRFWYDTPEATAARGLRAAEKYDEAFAALDRAIRNRPDSPELLRELYRLYEAIGLLDLCYRPLRMIEKLATVRGGTDTWVLETLARLCERLSKDRGGMCDRAVSYWSKLEKATGVSYARERNAIRATRTLEEGGYSKQLDE